MMMKMKIEFLYYEDCPSHDQALARLKQVMAEAGVDAPIEITKVETEDQVEALAFYGSPTIRINGQDIDPPGPDMRPMLSCRIYQFPDGRFSPLPSPDMIRRALKSSLTGQ